MFGLLREANTRYIGDSEATGNGVSEGNGKNTKGTRGNMDR